MVKKPSPFLGSQLLRDYLKAHHMSQGDLAYDFEVGVSTVSHWCLGTYPPNLEMAKRLAVFTADEIPVGSWGYGDLPVSRFTEPESEEKPVAPRLILS